MTRSNDHPAHEARADPERARDTNAFDASDGYSGQEYSREREEAGGRKEPSGHPIGKAVTTESRLPAGQDRDIPRDAGKRGSFDPKTGEVRGSGSGAGGSGSGEEDYDTGTDGGIGHALQADVAPDPHGARDNQIADGGCAE